MAFRQVGIGPGSVCTTRKQTGVGWRSGFRVLGRIWGVWSGLFDLPKVNKMRITNRGRVDKGETPQKINFTPEHVGRNPFLSYMR